REEEAEEVAAKERIVVVAARRSDAVRPRGRGVEGPTSEGADRRHVEVITPRIEVDTQTSDFDHELGEAETAAASCRNHRGRGRAARDERSRIAVGDAAPDFKGRGRDVGIREII